MIGKNVVQKVIIQAQKEPKFRYAMMTFPFPKGSHAWLAALGDKDKDSCTSGYHDPWTPLAALARIL